MLESGFTKMLVEFRRAIRSIVKYIQIVAAEIGDWNESVSVLSGLNSGWLVGGKPEFEITSWFGTHFLRLVDAFRRFSMKANRENKPTTLYKMLIKMKVRNYSEAHPKHFLKI